jgi:hypothetical protein
MWSKNERSAELHPRVEYVLLMGHFPSRYDVATSLTPFKDDGDNRTTQSELSDPRLLEVSGAWQDR